MCDCICVRPAQGAGPVIGVAEAAAGDGDGSGVALDAGDVARGVAVALEVGDVVAVDVGVEDGAGVDVGFAIGGAFCDENGWLSAGALRTSAATTTAVAAAAIAAAPPNSTLRRREGRSPVFCGDSRHWRRSGVMRMPSAATLAAGADA